MPKTATILLTTAGLDTGPFDLLSDVDSYITPFETNIPKSSLISGYTTNLVPDAATIVRVESTSALCTNYIDLNYPTTTTTTTAIPTTTTTTTTTSLIVCENWEIINGAFDNVIDYIDCSGNFQQLNLLAEEIVGCFSVDSNAFGPDIPFLGTQPYTFNKCP